MSAGLESASDVSKHQGLLHALALDEQGSTHLFAFAGHPGVLHHATPPILRNVCGGQCGAFSLSDLQALATRALTETPRTATIRTMMGGEGGWSGQTTHGCEPRQRSVAWSKAVLRFARSTVAVTLLVCGCSEGQESARDGQVVDLQQPVALELAPVARSGVERLRQLLDVDESTFLSAPSVDIATLKARPAEAIDWDRAASEFSSVLGEELPALETDPITGYIESVETASKGPSLRIDPKGSRFVLRTSAYGRRAAPVVFSNSELVVRATPFLEVLSIAPDQYSLSIHQLRAAERHRHSTAILDDFAVSHKLMIQRHIGGIPVIGDDMVVTLGLDGVFQKMIGRWSPVDYRASKLRTRMSGEQIVQRTLETAVERGWNEVPLDAVVLSTVYEFTDSSAGALTLRARLTGLTPEGKKKSLIVDIQAEE